VEKMFGVKTVSQLRAATNIEIRMAFPVA